MKGEAKGASIRPSQIEHMQKKTLYKGDHAASAYSSVPTT